ncbi:iron uptake transporter deferrochelatase/peroxidase subunit [Chromobacterium subtsugae]|uniref:iron uptake transporter deferrochelatase/peroxidase subunit n=1 Tax=Chromobacterium subtsugae TaxID=251747 RepID=UPI000640F5B7|nr:iron uptake transporter deferrochelatase/peroxidase subunit [Chromobacterium subtsugae]
MTNRDKPKQPSRRGFLKGGGALALAGWLGGGKALAAAAGHTKAAAQPGREPFDGVHQGGILTPQQQNSYFAAFDLQTAKREEVIALLKAWTEAARRLSQGLPARALSGQSDKAPLDSGEAVGLATARLTLTFGFGPGLFSKNGVDRYGLAKHRPEALVDLPKFNGDQLVPEKSGGDLSIQACADDPQVAFHAVRQLAAIADGIASVRWVQTGFASGAPGGGTPRNLMGFKDGTNNPSTKDPALMNQFIWVGDEGGWMKNGSYLVVRRIRIALEHWDKTELGFQQEVVGRYKDSGAPLGQKHEFEPMNLAAADKDGNPLIPDTAHSRVASPQENDGARILRRAYSYNDGANFYAERWPPWRQGVEYDAGLFFIAYQRDPRTGFIRINKKLAAMDMMNQYITHVGSAVFACPPGARPGGYIGEALFQL